MRHGWTASYFSYFESPVLFEYPAVNGRVDWSRFSWRCKRAKFSDSSFSSSPGQSIINLFARLFRCSEGCLLLLQVEGETYELGRAHTKIFGHFLPERPCIIWWFVTAWHLRPQYFACTYVCTRCCVSWSWLNPQRYRQALGWIGQNRGSDQYFGMNVW